MGSQIKGNRGQTLSDPHEIKLPMAEHQAAHGVTPEWVLRKLTDVALNGNTAESRVMALELIGRHLGMFTDLMND